MAAPNLPEKVETDIAALTAKLKSLLAHDVVFRIRTLEADLLADTCGVESWDVILLAIMKINNEHYDEIIPALEFFEKCPPRELDVQEAARVLRLFAETVDSDDDDFSTWRDNVVEQNWQTPSAQFLHDILEGYLYALESKDFTALTLLKNAQLSHGAKNIKPSVWLLGLWIEAYLYATLSDLKSLISAYDNLAEFSAIKDLPIDFGTSLYNISFLTQELGAQEVAISLYKEMEKFYAEVQDGYNLYGVYYGMAALYIDLDDYQSARECFEKAQLHQDAAPPYFIASSELLWAFTESRLGQVDNSLRHLERANQLFQDNLSLVPEELILAKRRVEADIAYSRGNSDEAYRLLATYHRESMQNLRNDFNRQFINAHADFVRQFRSKEQRIVEGSQTILFQRLLIVSTIALLLALTISLALMRRSEKRARKAAAQKSLLLASVSHELRTPLNAILGFAEVIESEVFGKLGGEKNKEYVGYIVSSGRHLRDLINQVMNVTTMAKRGQSNQCKAVELQALVKEIGETFALDIKEKNLHLLTDVHVKETIIVEATLLRQILINLLSNAIKFSRDNGTVSLFMQKGRRNILTIKIKDDGIGMSSDEVDMATDIFWRSNSGYNRDTNGSGLGLSIVKNIVDNLGGKLSIASARGMGTLVTVKIPL